MQRLPRILLVVTILLWGATIAPSVALPSQSFSREPYASAIQQPESIEIHDFAFTPNVIIIPVGTTVRWTNDDMTTHTVTSDTAGLFNLVLAPGANAEHLFDTPGIYTYHCSFHPSMTGEVIVANQVFDNLLPLVSKDAP